MLFLPRKTGERAQIEKLVERIVDEENQTLCGWRNVPTDDSLLGETARRGAPVIRQVFIGRDPRLGTGLEAQTRFERKLYVIRQRITREVDGLNLHEAHLFYVASLSSQTLV